MAGPGTGEAVGDERVGDRAAITGNDGEAAAVAVLRPVGRFERRRSDGSPVWLQATYTPILNADGVPYKVVKFASDMTDRVLLEAQAAEQLSHAPEVATTSTTSPRCRPVPMLAGSMAK